MPSLRHTLAVGLALAATAAHGRKLALNKKSGAPQQTAPAELVATAPAMTPEECGELVRSGACQTSAATMRRDCPSACAAQPLEGEGGKCEGWRARGECGRASRLGRRRPDVQSRRALERERLVPPARAHTRHAQLRARGTHPRRTVRTSTAV